MKNKLSKGKLITWKGDRGFGFIKPSNGGKEVFIHISEFKRVNHRPKVGDIIFYQPVNQENGKISATKVSIEDLSSRRLPNKHKRKKTSLLKNCIGGSIGIIALFTMNFTRISFPDSTVSTSKLPIKNKQCTIKGNISINTGKKLYHLPGMEDYESTRIHQDKGERWFCTESEAKKNGWQKAPR